VNVKQISRRFLLFALIITFVSSCDKSDSALAFQSTVEVLVDNYVAATTAAIASKRVIPSDTPTQTATATPFPTETPTVTPTNTSTPVPTLGSSDIYLNIYFIPSNADGPIGCGEELVALSTGILPTGDAITDVRVALEKLFSVRVQYQYGTYNPLYSSSLIITSVQFEDEFDEIVARTTGNLNRGEKGCDWGRIRLMVRATTKAASGGQSVEVRFNQHAFNDYVSSDV
jgi:hypothetical protein